MVTDKPTFVRQLRMPSGFTDMSPEEMEYSGSASALKIIKRVMGTVAIGVGLGLFIYGAYNCIFCKSISTTSIEKVKKIKDVLPNKPTSLSPCKVFCMNLPIAFGGACIAGAGLVCWDVF